ncbi:hypothetical protein VTI74DRAFT_8291 [Chaetomium olivicolor]
MHMARSLLAPDSLNEMTKARSAFLTDPNLFTPRAYKHGDLILDSSAVARSFPDFEMDPSNERESQQSDEFSGSIATEDDISTQGTVEARRDVPAQEGFSIADQAQKVVQLLREYDIPCCLVGTKALCYYGSHRLCTVLEFCVPTEKLSAVDEIFSSGAAGHSYKPWRGRHPKQEPRQRRSIYHTFPRYRPEHDGPLFDFYLVPSDDWRFDCIPEIFEYSAQKHLPYPRLHLFAQSLMKRQSFNDLQDLVDGMDLTEEWGNENLKFEDLGEKYWQWVKAKDEKIRAALPAEVHTDPMIEILDPEIYELDEEPDGLRKMFNHLVRTKEGRVGPELGPPGSYVTKYRAKGSPDPRSRVRFNV